MCNITYLGHKAVFSPLRTQRHLPAVNDVRMTSYSAYFVPKITVPENRRHEYSLRDRTDWFSPNDADLGWLDQTVVADFYLFIFFAVNFPFPTVICGK